MRFSRFGLALIFLSSSILLGVVRADYQAPDLSHELMTRDGLSLDADAMESLAQALIDLSGASGEWTPEQQRLHAKMIALALFLDKDNSQAKDLNKQLSEGAKPAVKDERTQIAASRRIFQSVRWLSSAEAGKASNRLADYLLDVMIFFDRDHPLAKDYDVEGEFGRWKQVVAPLRDFGGASQKPSNNSGADWNTPKEKEPEKPAESEAKPAEPKFPADLAFMKDTTAVSQGVGRLYDSKRTRTYPSIITFKMKGSSWGDNSEMDLKFEPWVDDKAKRLTQNFERLISSRFKRGNQKHHLRIYTTFAMGLDSVSMELNDLPLMIGVDQLVSGIDPVFDVISFGKVNDDGTISGGSNAWAAINILREKLASVQQDFQSRGRKPPLLLIPSDVAELFVNVIALNEPEFFISYECIGVKNLDEVRDLIFKKPNAELTKALGGFEDVQRVALTKNIRTLAPNKYVRSKLMETLRAEPRHLSAKMLLIQGSGRRPSKLEREVLALELKTLISRVERFLGENQDQMRKDGRIMKLWESAREETDAIERYVGIGERDLHKQSVEVIDYLRTIDRYLSRGEDGKNEARGDIKKAKGEAGRLLDQLRVILGEPDPDKVVIPK